MHSIRLHTGTDEPGLRVHTRGEAIVAKILRPLRKLTLLDAYRRIPAPTSPARTAARAALSVRPSRIPGAGHGLFTTVTLPANAVVNGCTYGGKVMTLMEAR